MSKEFVPKAGGKKKKKRKKKKKKQSSPEQDPHFSISPTKPDERQNTDNKPKPKHKRKQHFEVDTHAPDTARRGNFNRDRSKFGGYGNYGNGGLGANRPARGKRIAVSTDNADLNMDDLNKLDREYKKTTDNVKVLEDKSDDEEDEDEEKKEKMDIDGNHKKEINSDDVIIDEMDHYKNHIDEEETENDDPWECDDDDDGDNNGADGDINMDMNDRYTPITLKKKTNYGVINKSEMHNIFKEKEMGMNEFMFIQLPPMLPFVAQLNDDEKRDIEKGKKVEQNLLRQMGEGEIGKIRIRKSGKTELVMGDYVLDVNFSCPMDCYQQVMHIHCEEINDGSGERRGKSQFLGHVPPQNNLVCSYRAKDLVL